jgi:two-component system, OmpR family, phosphate regulon sensor histidine kinase PhoR
MQLSGFFNIRLLFATLLVLAGTLISGQLNNNFERFMVIFVTLMIAVFVAVDRGGGRVQDAPPLDIPSPMPIREHPQFAQLLDASTDPTLIVENARVMAANTSALQLLGNTIVGQNVAMAFRHAGAIERLSDPNAQHQGTPIRLTGIGLRDQLWDMRMQSIGDGQKLVTLADRTSSQAAEKMRVDFVANASHELLTPLASVKGFIETLTEPEAGGDTKTRNRFLKIMADETARMQALIRDLISLSRIEAEKYEMAQTPVNLGQIIADVVGIFRDGSDQRASDIDVTIAKNLQPVMGDPLQLHQVISNLIANAMKYGKAGTPVLVQLNRSQSGQMLAFSVNDQGEGIAPEHLPRLTERFYRVDSGRSRSIGGTGLGLSLVKHIVDRHRGHLEIRSELGKGTNVTILLPIAPKQTGANA